MRLKGGGFFEEGESATSEEKKKGLLSRVWEKIIELIDAILAVFKKKRIDKVPNVVKIEVDAKAWDEEGKRLKLGKEIPNMIKHPMKYFKDGNRKQKMLQIFTTGAVAAAAPAVIYGIAGNGYKITDKGRELKHNTKKNMSKIISVKDYKERQREKVESAEAVRRAIREANYSENIAAKREGRKPRDLMKNAERLARADWLTSDPKFAKDDSPYGGEVSRLLQKIVNGYIKSTTKFSDKDYEILRTCLDEFPSGGKALGAIDFGMRKKLSSEDYDKWEQSARYAEKRYQKDKKS